MSGFGRFLCWMGLLLAAWTAAEHVTEEAVMAVVSRCVVTRSGPDLLTYGPWPPWISCAASYRRNGQDISAELHARLPSDYDPERESRLVEVWVSPLSPQAVRFRNHAKDWGTPTAKVLALELLGLLLIVAARRSPDFSTDDD